MQPNLGFSLVQVILALNLLERPITRTPSSSETEVSLSSFGVQNKLISFSLFLMFRFSNKSVFEQPSRANCVRQPRFDTCLQIITSKKHLDIFYSNLKKYLTSRLYNLTSRLLQNHLNLDENNLKWQLCLVTFQPVLPDFLQVSSPNGISKLAQISPTLACQKIAKNVRS